MGSVKYEFTGLLSIFPEVQVHIVMIIRKSQEDYQYKMIVRPFIGLIFYFVNDTGILK